MNEREKKQRRNQLSSRILVRYVLMLLVFTLIYLASIPLAYALYHKIYYGQYLYLWLPMRHFVQTVRNYLPFFASMPYIAGVLWITHKAMEMPLQYLEDVIDVSAQLIADKQSPVELPEELRTVQDQLELFRVQALRSEQLAKEEKKRKDDMIVYLAHDLKTPLTSVIGYLSLLRDEPQISSETRAKYVGIALDKALRLEELINEFFDITRFNLTTMTLVPEPTDLTRMLEQVAFEFQPLLQEKELTLTSQLDPNVKILCDRDKLGRVFDNLLKNAINYSYYGSEIHLSMEQKDDFAVVRMQNHGASIAPEKLEHIFEQFFRMDSSRSTATGGAGLGLAIAREIVELHGGTITAESEQESILFTVTLPLHCKKNV